MPRFGIRVFQEKGTQSREPLGYEGRWHARRAFSMAVVK